MNEMDLDYISKKLKSDFPATWVFTGDSITHGASHTNGFRSYPEHFAERVRYELERFQDIIINTGISGDTADKILESFDWRMDYNHYRPHSSLDYMAPAAFAKLCIDQGSATLRLAQDREHSREILS